VPAPELEPIGLHLARVAKVASRAFDDVLTEAGGSLPTWLILVSVKSRTHGNQRNLAEAVGIEGPTLTHHLNRMEREGLVTRRRDPSNRRVHLVELTQSGDALFFHLLDTVVAFDEQLRRGLGDADLRRLRCLLDRIGDNVSPPGVVPPPPDR